MKNKTKKVLEEMKVAFKNQSIDIFGNVLIFFIFIPVFAIYAWFLGIIIRATVIALIGYEPVGMNWFVYGLMAGTAISMIIGGIQEGGKSLKELFKALLIYSSYLGLIFIAITFWLFIVILLKIKIIIQ